MGDGIKLKRSTIMRRPIAVAEVNDVTHMSRGDDVVVAQQVAPCLVNVGRAVNAVR